MFTTLVVFDLGQTAVACFILFVLSATTQVFSDINLDDAGVLLCLWQSHRRVLIPRRLVITCRVYRVLLSTVLLQLSFQGLEVLLITRLAITLDRIRRSCTNDFIGAPVLS